MLLRNRFRGEDYSPVTYEQPCPKCGRPDWCLLHVSGSKCICNRVQSGKALGMGWLHYLSAGDVEPIVQPKEKRQTLTSKQVQEYLDTITTGAGAAMLRGQARQLELSVRSLLTMQARYDGPSAAVIFPMFDGQRSLIGCRFRRSDGRKWALKGGREGVFLSTQLDISKPVFIVEGPTDAAALCYAGLSNVIGRPNCQGGVLAITELLCRNLATPVIILSDPDDPGTNGATHLATHLRNPAVVIVGPSDPREFITRHKLPDHGRYDILVSLTGYDSGPWREIHRNQTGQFYPFDRKLDVPQSA